MAHPSLYNKITDKSWRRVIETFERRPRWLDDVCIQPELGSAQQFTLRMGANLASRDDCWRQVEWTDPRQLAFRLPDEIGSSLRALEAAKGKDSAPQAKCASDKGKPSTSRQLVLPPEITALAGKVLDVTFEHNTFDKPLHFHLLSKDAIATHLRLVPPGFDIRYEEDLALLVIDWRVLFAVSMLFVIEPDMLVDLTPEQAAFRKLAWRLTYDV